MRTGVIHRWAALLGGALLAGQVMAQEDSAADAAANANKPLANMKAFNLQNYYIGELTGSEERCPLAEVPVWLPADMAAQLCR